MKKKKKEKKILYQLIFSAFLLFSNAYLVKANSDILSQDSTGKYCINTEQDYYNFIENIQNYNNKTVILCNDIDISDVPEATSSFGGILNGKGHTITYASKEAKENIAVFPFRINDNGIVENINVQIDESYAYNSETDEFQTVFSQCDGIAKGITIKGNVTCIYDDEDEDCGDEIKELKKVKFSYAEILKKSEKSSPKCARKSKRRVNVRKKTNAPLLKMNQVSANMERVCNWVFPMVYVHQSAFSTFRLKLPFR